MYHYHQTWQFVYMYDVDIFTQDWSWQLCVSLFSILKDSGKGVLFDRASADLTAAENDNNHCHSGMTSSRADKKKRNGRLAYSLRNIRRKYDAICWYNKYESNHTCTVLVRKLEENYSNYIMKGNSKGISHFCMWSSKYSHLFKFIYVYHSKGISHFCIWLS